MRIGSHHCDELFLDIENDLIADIHLGVEVVSLEGAMVAGFVCAVYLTNACGDLIDVGAGRRAFRWALRVGRMGQAGEEY